MAGRLPLGPPPPPPKKNRPDGPAARRGPAEGARDVTAEIAGHENAMSVSSLVMRIKEAMLDAFPRPVAVIGQISNFKRHSSGHLYFSLKDDVSTVDAVMFRADAASVRFNPTDGLEVVAEGRVDVYERQGRLQLYIQRLTPRGVGALELAFRQLKDKLAKEGLFDPAHKVPLPRYPRAIGVITSPTGAAIRDVARALGRRWPTPVFLLPVRVQGEQSAAEVAAAIALMDANAERLGIDTIILARGGGSLEDLWSFNEEIVARAIFACRTPIVVGVGHEVDVTIADYVADVRAATPTAAAELATPDRAAVARALDVLSGRLTRRVRELAGRARTQLAGLVRSGVFRDPTGRLRSLRVRLDELAGNMRQALRDAGAAGRKSLAQLEQSLTEHHPRRLHERAAARLEQLRRDLAWALGHRAKLSGDRLTHVAGALAAADPRHRAGLARQKVEALARQLEAMSYRRVLARGYSVTRRPDGVILRSTAEAPPGTRLETELADGRVQSVVPGGDSAAKPRKKPPADDRPGLFG